jgi:hypothetical protein
MSYWTSERFGHQGDSEVKRDRASFRDCFCDKRDREQKKAGSGGSFKKTRILGEEAQSTKACEFDIPKILFQAGAYLTGYLLISWAGHLIQDFCIRPGESNGALHLLQELLLTVEPRGGADGTALHA